MVGAAGPNASADSALAVGLSVGLVGAAVLVAVVAVVLYKKRRNEKTVTAFNTMAEQRQTRLDAVVTEDPATVSL
jgi:hypothetical protein